MQVHFFLKERVVTALDGMGELENTYIFYTSDHGYHLGKHTNIVCTSDILPFDFLVTVLGINS